MSDFNAQNRFGSARFANYEDVRRAGMFNQKPGSLLVGFIGNKPLWYDGDGGVLLTAGARGGKLSTMLGYNVCHSIHSGPMLILDIKGELSRISSNQTPDGKFRYHWNPRGLHGLPQDRVNPLGYIKIGSPSLVSDIKVFTENFITPASNHKDPYFIGRAQEFVEGIALTVTKLTGELNFPDLYRAINLIPGGGEEWLDFAFEMSEAGYPLSSRIEEEIAASRENSTNGFQGILGEIFRAFACLSDPVLMESVSPPYTFSMEALCDDEQNCDVSLMPPAEFIGPWSPIIKSILVAGMIYKSRKPQARRQTWIIDEAAQLGNFPLISKLYEYGAGAGIRPLCVFQSSQQMRAIGPNAETIISSSAQLKSYFSVRDLESATMISRMLGSQTLIYDDEHQQQQARHAKQQTVQAFMNGGDPFSAGLNYAHHRREAGMQKKQQRMLRTPDEVLGMPGDKQFIFFDGLDHPIEADRKAYWEQKVMAGRFEPNPYHPPLDKVRVKTTFGHGWRNVIREPVPDCYAHYPQYASGYWTRLA